MSTNTDALPPLPLSEDEVRRLWDKACRTVTVQGGGNDVLVFADYLHRALAAQQGAQVPQDAARKLVNNFARACCFGDDAARIAAGDALVAALSASPQVPAQTDLCHRNPAPNASQPMVPSAGGIVTIGAAPAGQKVLIAKGIDLDGMCEAFHRLIEAHANLRSPFHQPVCANAQLALRELRDIAASIKRHNS